MTEKNGGRLHLFSALHELSPASTNRASIATNGTFQPRMVKGNHDWPILSMMPEIVRAHYINSGLPKTPRLQIEDGIDIVSEYELNETCGIKSNQRMYK